MIKRFCKTCLTCWIKAYRGEDKFNDITDDVNQTNILLANNVNLHNLIKKKMGL